jgi:hypothetical protein
MRSGSDGECVFRLRLDAEDPPVGLGSRTRFSPAGDDGDAVGADPPSVIDEETDVAIRVEGLTKRYGDVAAVDELSFSVRRGSVTGFLGPTTCARSRRWPVCRAIASARCS